MKLKELLSEIPNVCLHADPDMEITDICYDLRLFTPGCMFAQIENYPVQDVRLVMQQGASVLLCNTPPENSIPYILTDNVRYTYSLLCCQFFGKPADSMKMIGITGTNGKTTTTMLVKYILEQALGVKAGLIGTVTDMIGSEEIETHCTTPESHELQELLLRMKQSGCSYVVMEVSSQGLSEYRTAGITFAAGGFSNLTQDHLDFHKTMDAYAQAKASLFSSCDQAVINMDDDWSFVMLKYTSCPVVGYSVSGKETDLAAYDINIRPDGSSFILKCKGKYLSASIPLPARYNVSNALLAIGICQCLGVAPEKSMEILRTVPSVRGRLENVAEDKDYSVFIDYAHTPDALEKLLYAMREMGDNRIILVFGCGGDCDRTKRPKMGRIAAELSDMVIITSDNARTEPPEQIIADIIAGIPSDYSNYEIIADRKQAIEYALKNRKKNDIILLAGKGHEKVQLINSKVYPFDEREIVQQYLFEEQHR